MRQCPPPHTSAPHYTHTHTHAPSLTHTHKPHIQNACCPISKVRSSPDRQGQSGYREPRWLNIERNCACRCEIQPKYSQIQWPGNTTNTTNKHTNKQNKTPETLTYLTVRVSQAPTKVDDSSPPLDFFLPSALPIHCAKWYIYIGHNLNHYARRLCWMCRQTFLQCGDADRAIMGAIDRNPRPRHPSNQTTPLQ